MPRSLLLTAGTAEHGAVSLTFDDGPHPEGTPRVLAALAERGARATFFLQGANAERYPELVARIHQAGHELGHHSWSHSRPSEVSAQALADETVRTRELLRTLTGVDTSLFRPPHGKLTARKLVALWGLGQTVVLWSADPGDVFQESPLTFAKWIDRNPPRSGDIFLLHDRAPALRDGLPHLLDAIQRQGLEVATVGEFLGRPVTTKVRSLSGAVR